MIKRVVLVLAMAAIVCMPAVASAALFNFNYSGTGITTIGTLTADLFAPGAYHITGISGTRNGDAITSFATGGPNVFVYQDNNLDNVLLVPQNPAFLSNTSTNGFAFGTLAGGFFSPYFDTGSGSYYEYTVNSGSIPGTAITFNAAPVPIPAAVWLLGSGLIGLVGLRRRFKN